jgi:exopolysaccharide biosynthesis polyprenyl glycosylphosphotransferase
MLLFLATRFFFPYEEYGVKLTGVFLFQIAIVWSIFLYKFRLGIIFRAKSFLSRFRGYLVTIIFGCSLLLLEIEFIPLFKQISYTSDYLLAFAILNLATLVIFKLVFYNLMRFIRSKGHNTRNLIIIADTESLPFIDYFIHSKDWGYHIIGIVSPNKDFKYENNEIKIIDNINNLKQFITKNPIDDIFYCLPIEDKSFNLEQLINESDEIGVNLHIMQREYLQNMIFHSKKSKGFENSFITYSKFPRHYIGLKIKDFIDIIFSIIVLLVLAPFLVFIALMIKLEDGGPVLFQQERIGLNGRRFRFYKFRSMVPNAEALKELLEDKNEADGPVFKIENDPRITKIGRFLRKTSLDELPQFYNVIKGDMSVVGPRPPLLKEVQQYERPQLRRLSLKPGITCIWQVWGRHDVTFEKWMQMDLDYIDNWSLYLDLKIAIATVGVVFKANGH